MYPVITVTLTPAVDVTVPVATLSPGALHRIAAVYQDAGGKGINVTKALQIFGVPSLATGILGGSRGQWIANELRHRRIPVEFIDTPEETRLNVKITEGNGRLTELNSQSVIRDGRVLEELRELLVKHVKAGSWVCFCGGLPTGAADSWYKESILAVKQAGGLTVLDASGSGLLEGIKGGPDVVKPNRAELERYIGHPLPEVPQIVNAACSLLDYDVQIVVVSLGADGLIGVRRVQSQRQAFRVQVPQIESGSAVGAGDTTVAGLIYSLLAKSQENQNQLSALDADEFKEALCFAAAAGTAAAQTEGTTPPLLSAVKAVMSRVYVESLPIS